MEVRKWFERFQRMEWFFTRKHPEEDVLFIFSPSLLLNEKNLIHELVK